MAQYRKVGNKGEILQANQERTSWEILLNGIANMSEAELDVWFSNHFTGISGEMGTGMEMIVKALWANAKVTKKLWLQANV